MYDTFLTKILLPVRPSYTSRKTLEEFMDIDVTTERVAKIVERNQYFESLFMREVQSLSGGKQLSSLHNAISLLGIQKARDFIIALQILRNVLRKHPKLSQTEKAEFPVKESIQFALKTEEFVAKQRLQYADTAYSAGLVYDFMLHIGRENFKAGRSYEEYLQEVYQHGLKTARIGVELAKELRVPGFSKYIFSACLLHDIGKLAMDLLFPSDKVPSFQTFRAELSKKPVGRVIRHYIEGKRFGITHEILGSFIVFSTIFFREIEKLILYHHAPYLVSNLVPQSNIELYQVAHLIALSSNIANNFCLPKDMKDPIYSAWVTPEVKGLKVDPRILKKVIEIAERCFRQLSS